MKVKLEKDYKKYYTMLDVDRAKLVIQFEKEDDETAAGWAEYAVREALQDSMEYCNEIIRASAETSRNHRIWDAYGEGTGSMDVYITALAKTSEGFIEIGAYLSDIWQSGAEPYKHQMYISQYRPL